MPGQLDMARCLEVLSSWIKNCDNNHSHCAPCPPAKLPARVLDVGNRGTQNVVRLHETQRELAHYTTLSHCWGKKRIVTTTKATFEQRKLELPLHRNVRQYGTVAAHARGKLRLRVTFRIHSTLSSPTAKRILFCTELPPLGPTV